VVAIRNVAEAKQAGHISSPPFWTNEERTHLRGSIEERFLSAQSDTFAGANVKKRRRLAPLGMTGF
jgi:hypothetical protein